MGDYGRLRAYRRHELQHSFIHPGEYLARRAPVHYAERVSLVNPNTASAPDYLMYDW